jgi:S1-C subfamily serine protease
MEDLSKHQLILIVLLITFVTSIATAIITFTLLQEAPVEVTQQINRVIERTIQEVAPATKDDQKVVTTTVVVNEDDSITQSIAKNEKSIVRLETTGADGSNIISGLGLVISNDGTIVADLRSYNGGSVYKILFYDGKEYSAAKVFQDTEHGLVFIKSGVPQNESPKYVFYPAVLGDSNVLKIGQTVIAISGRDSNAASVGRVFQLIMGSDKKTVTSISSDIKASKSNFGSPILNLSGEVVGIEAPLTEIDRDYSYIPINVVKAAVTKALEQLSK